MKRAIRAVVVCAIVGLTVPSYALAQAQTKPSKPPKNPHWAASFSVTPSWKIAPFLATGLGDEGSPVDFRGSEWTIGFGRGSRRGGDWGVSYVRKPFKDGVIQTEHDTNCFTPFNQPQLCATSTNVHTFNKVLLSGVEVHWFIPVATIKNRVQIGINFGGGAANFKGTVHSVEDGQDIQFVPGPGGGTNVLVPFHTEEDKPVAEELIKTFPLIKVEVQGAIILSSAFKIKVGGGLNFPASNSFRVAAVYLIGG
jgi:hypothetical protein